MHQALRKSAVTRHVSLFPNSLPWVPRSSVPHVHRYYGSEDSPRPSHAPPVSLGARYRSEDSPRRRRGLPGSRGILVNACPGLGTPAARGGPRTSLVVASGLYRLLAGRMRGADPPGLRPDGPPGRRPLVERPQTPSHDVQWSDPSRARLGTWWSVEIQARGARAVGQGNAGRSRRDSGISSGA